MSEPSEASAHEGDRDTIPPSGRRTEERADGHDLRSRGRHDPEPALERPSPARHLPDAGPAGCPVDEGLFHLLLTPGRHGREACTRPHSGPYTGQTLDRSDSSASQAVPTPSS